jgi:hypothetical protein
MHEKSGSYPTERSHSGKQADHFANRYGLLGFSGTMGCCCLSEGPEMPDHDPLQAGDIGARRAVASSEMTLAQWDREKMIDWGSWAGEQQLHSFYVVPTVRSSSIGITPECRERRKQVSHITKPTGVHTTVEEKASICITRNRASWEEGERNKAGLAKQ